MSILVAGSLHLDVVLNAPHLPTLDETVAGSRVDYVFGGKGGNQAIAASRMGARVHFIGRAGSDAFGDMIRETLGASAVDVSQLQRDPGPSGMSAAIVNGDGEYGAVIVSAANLHIDAGAVFVPEGCGIVLLQNEIPQAVNLAIARKAKEAGAQVWLNAAPARALPADLVAVVDLLIVNRIEAAFYASAGISVETLTTLGAQGVLYQGHAHGGYQVEVISTHGAGDAFVGALAAQVSAGSSVADGIDFAQAAAALHVSSEVAKRAELTRGLVKEFCAAYDKR